MIREHDRGRPLAEILEDRYVLNRLQSPQQRARLLDRPEILQAVGGDKAQAAKAEAVVRARRRPSSAPRARRARRAPPARRGAAARVPVETTTSTTIVITYGSAWKSCGGIVTPRAWRMSGSAENAPKA